MKDLQKGDMWKRISAYMFDKILLFTVIVGVAFLLSFLFDFDKYSSIQSTRQDEIEAEYGVDLSISEEEYNKLSADEKASYEAAKKALSEDDEVWYALEMMFWLALLITSFSVLIGYLLLEFTVPLLLGNGQTLGKKIFSLGVMRTDSVRISAPILFVRTILGKYTIETMIPLVILIGIAFGVMGFFGPVVLAALLMANVLSLVRTETRSALHDVLAHTVCVDFTSQMIFDTPEALMAYKERVRQEMAERTDG